MRYDYHVGLRWDNPESRADTEMDVEFIVDDAGKGRDIGDDMHAIVYAHSKLVRWQTDNGPIVVSAHSYLSNSPLDDSEAIELSRDYLTEIGYILEGEPELF